MDNEEEFARNVLAGLGYDLNFEDLSYRDYQGVVRYAAQNSAGKWACSSYSYGSCELCDATYGWTQQDYMDALMEPEVDLDNKPSAGWF